MAWDEVNNDGTVYVSGIGLIPSSGIQLDVSQAFDDNEPRKRVLLDVHCGNVAYQFALTADKAESLAKLLLHSACSLRGQAPHGEGEH